LICFIFMTSGCGILDDNDAPSSPSATGVIVANGGNYSDQNGSLTLHDPATRKTTQTSSMGGFIQGLSYSKDRLHVLFNTFGPGRIDILDPSNLTLTAQWTGMDSPRDMAIGENDAWVTTSVWGEPGELLNLSSTGSIVQSIQVGNVPESVALWGETAVVANNGSLGGGTTLSVLTVGTGQVSTVDVGCDGPRDLYVAAELIVVCSGKTVYTPDFSEILEQTPGQIVFLDAAFEVVARIRLDEQIGSTNGTETGFHSEDTDELFVTVSSSETIIIVDLITRQTVATVDLSGQEGLIGLSGVAYDAGRDQIYVGRFPVSGAGSFPDYAAAGTVQVLDRGGQLQHAFTAGASISTIILQQ
jgi:hypothetical protein